mmetsp:Transcript_39582/g.95689  ORF Transcript_39582/g.95689 Transcript_39582/m.95689 type:complete len:404 (-) Transcript_39582:183-1394(-)|eukprot:CAMPEP_0113644702 /NCGR_PEP_ID=MMETSP0017_2-20120614/23533_1 /TAXON_ID=2856 /ORGANISM="Cylindrotheca closterium" /LENGTH=403 /DNA_ID=CAMNT_0000556339 /DNA_START=52 /DNA_END=1263 /DNA_ORIENTATION=+ /assembly_acc=CAM_ASM_000147
MTNEFEQHDSFFSQLPELTRESISRSSDASEIDEFILTEMCKEVAAMFGGKDYDSDNLEEDYENFANKDVASSGGDKDDNDSIKSSAMIDIVRKSLAGVQIDGVSAIDRFSMSLENPEEQRKLLEYFQKAKLEREQEARAKAEQQEAERIKRQEQDRLEREEREAKAKKAKEEKERKERHERERKERKERERKERERKERERKERERKERERKERKRKEEKERKERKERERKERERKEREAKERAEREAKERAEQEARARAEREAQAARAAQTAAQAQAAQARAAQKQQMQRERQELQALEGQHQDMIEVAPGLTLPLLSKDATFRALEQKNTITTTCFICQQTLTAPGHVNFVVCCDDWICMAVEENDNASTDQSKRCIGFGLKDGEIAKWVMFSRKSVASG